MMKSIQRALTRALTLLIISAMLTTQFSSAANARFISPDDMDPTLPGVGTNRYAYAGNDPINKSDPNGHIWGAVVAGITAVFGAFFGGTTYANAPASAKDVKSESQRQQLGGMALGAVTGLKGLGYAKKGYEAYSKKKDKNEEAKAASAAEEAASVDPIPGRVQSRTNLKNEGWEHIVYRHFNTKKNSSQFTIDQQELRSLLQDKSVVNSQISKVTTHGTFVRSVDVGKIIGTDKFSNYAPTSTLTVITDNLGNLLTAHPGNLP